MHCTICGKKVKWVDQALFDSAGGRLTTRSGKVEDEGSLGGGGGGGGQGKGSKSKYTFF